MSVKELQAIVMRLRISLNAAAVVAVITAGIAAATDVTAVVDG